MANTSVAVSVTATKSSFAVSSSGNWCIGLQASYQAEACCYQRLMLHHPTLTFILFSPPAGNCFAFLGLISSGLKAIGLNPKIPTQGKKMQMDGERRDGEGHDMCV